MKRYSRLISIILCFSVLIGCMVIPAYAAVDNTIHSYMYFDFTNPGAIAANSYENFTIYGDNSITGNVIYILCSRSGATLTDYVSSDEFVIDIEELWKNGNICCYRVKSNSARAFNREFKMRATNSSSGNGVFNIYKVFAVAAAGIVELDASGLTSSYALCGTSMSSPIHGSKITSLPYIFESQIATNIYSEYYLDINIPITKFIGMEQGSFTAYAASVSQTFMGLGSYLISCSLLYNGSPISYQYSTSETTDSIGGSTHYNGDYSEGINRPLGTYLTVYFDIPEQIPANEAYITARFVYKADETPFHFYFQHLYGRYSFAKTEYELLNDLYDILVDIDVDVNNVSMNINSLKTALHSDLTKILTELKSSNDFLSSIDDVLGDILKAIVTLDFSGLLNDLLDELEATHDSNILWYDHFQGLFGSIISSLGTSNTHLYNVTYWLSHINNNMTISFETVFGLIDESNSILNDISTLWMPELDSVLTSIRNNIINFRSSMIEGFNNVFIWLNDLGTGIVNTIASWSQGIIDAIVGDDDGAAEDFENHAQDQAGQVSDGIGKLDAVEKPDIGSIDANVDDYLDTSAVGLLASTINIFFQNHVFYSIFSLVLLMMLASYVLFGKK